jgi:hypothetical protein
LARGARQCRNFPFSFYSGIAEILVVKGKATGTLLYKGVTENFVYSLGNPTYLKIAATGSKIK